MTGKRIAIGKKPPGKLSGALYGRVCQILESARTSAARSVNTAQVVANWMVGREIVEEEQQGQDAPAMRSVLWRCFPNGSAPITARAIRRRIWLI